MSGTRSAPIIDAHVALGEEHYLRLGAAELAGRMEENGIALAIARPMGAEVAVFNRRGNERVLSAGPRVRGLVTASPWLGAQATEELKWGRERGGVGLYLHPTRQGFMPTDEIVEPLIAYARGAGWPVVFHTGTYVQSDVLAVAEVARRFPEVTFVCEGAGFSDMWFELPGVMAEAPNVVLLASLIWPKAIEIAVKTFGAARVMFGSGEPRDRIGAALARVERIGLSEPQRRAVLHDNAASVFRLGEGVVP